MTSEKEFDVDIEYVYQLLFKVTNSFLTLANKFGIHGLKKKHDPTVEEIAESAITLAGIMNQIADDKWEDERLALNAAQAALFMRKVAVAVRNTDIDLFNEGLKDLENHELV